MNFSLHTNAISAGERLCPRKTGSTGVCGVQLVCLRVLLIVILLGMGSWNSIAQSLGDFRSNATPMNWSEAGSWQTWNGNQWVTATTYPGQVAGSGDVRIQDGHTVTIDVSPVEPITRLFVGEGTSGILQYEEAAAQILRVDGIVTINQNAVFRSALTGTVTTHQLITDGSIVNNGTINFSTNNNTAGVGITFTGTGTFNNEVFDFRGATLTNLRAANGLLLNKGTNVLSFLPGGTFQVQSANAVGFLTIQSGTFSLMGENTFTNPLFYATTGSYTIPSTGGFDLNNPNATITGIYGTLTNHGALSIKRGVFNIGDGTGNESLTTSTGRFEMSGGRMDISGRFRVDAGSCTLTGGTLNLATIGHANRTLAAFHISESATLTMSGDPLITFAFPNSNSTPFNDIEIVAGTGTKTIIGGTFQLGTDATPDYRTFLINSDIPIHNLVVYNDHARVQLTDHMTVNNQLTLNGRLLMSNFNLNLGAAAILGDLRSSHGMVVTGTGQIYKTINAPGSYIFPFGNSSATYLPVTLDFTGGTFIPGATVSVGMTPNKYPRNVNTTNYLNRFWTVSTTGITNPVFNFTGNYIASDVTGQYAYMTTGVYTTAWRKLGASNNIGTTIYAAGLTENADITGITAAAPGVSVTAVPATVCSGSPVQLTATATGDAPFAYSWSPSTGLSATNIANPVATPTTITPTTVTYTVTVTDAMGGSASGSTTVTVNPNLLASVSIASNDADNTICEGTNVTFTATPVNGGTPSYQWFVGTTPVGTNSPSFTTNTLTTGQTVTVVMTSTAPCATGSPATSNPITTTVNPNLPVSVSIASNDADNTICAGTPVTLTATPVNEGPIPTYQWRVNGNIVGSNSATYSYTPSNNDLITCELTSTATCATGSPAQSNEVRMTVNPLLPVSVSIAASANSICAGTPVTLTATPANEGPNPTYQWRVNGNIVGTNSATYSYTPSDNDLITCELTSTATCATGSPATSNQVTITVNPLPTATIAGTTAVCVNETAPSVTFTGVAGTSPYTFTYTVNGGTNQTVSTTSGNSVTVASPTSTAGTFTYSLVSVQDVNCSQAQSGEATITVNPLPTATIAGTTTVCQNALSPNVTFTGNSGTAPYTFTYTINGGTNQTVSSTSGNSVTVASPTSTAGTFTYSLISVQDASSTTCSQNQAGTATVTVNPLPTATIAGTTTVCQNETAPTLTFTGAGGTAPYTFTYRINNGSNATITTTNGNSATLPAPTGNAGSFIYSLVSVQDANCSQAQSGEATVTVNSLPTATIAGTTTVCQNATSPTLTFTGAGGTAPYTFTYRINGGTDQSIVSTGTTATVAVPTGTAGIFVYELISVRDAGSTLCSQNQTGSATITIHPTPTASISGTQAVCRNSSPEPTITLTNPMALPVTITYNINGGGNTTVNVAANDIATISQPTTTAGEYFYTLVSVAYQNAPTCSNSVSGSATVTVNPTPTVNTVENRTLCTNATAPEITLSGAVTGTTYAWTNSNPTIGLSASGSGNIPSFLTTNGTNGPISGSITVIPAANGCVGTPIAFTITVNPTPTVNVLENRILCNNTTAPEITLSGPVTGTTFAWTNSNPGIGLAASGSGNIPSFLTTNGTNGPISGSITVIPAANGCVGTPIAFTITVNPTPTVNVLENRILCNNTTAPEITLSGPVTGTTFTWTNSNPGIGLAASGSGNIPSFLTTNGTNGPISGSITVTPAANGCVGTPLTFTITVNPTPTVNPIENRILCNNTTAPGITLSGPVSGTTFAWTNSNPGIGLAASGSGNIPQFQTINGTNGALEGIITVTPTANGCVGTPLTFILTVNPTLTASISGGTTVCQNDPSPNITFTNPMSVPVTITYRRNSIAHTINVAASNTNTVPVPTITADTYTYELVTVAYQSNPTCPNNITGSAIVIVNPKANAVPTPGTQAICSGQAITPIVLSSSTAGVTYNWTRNNTTTVTGIANSGSGNISGTLTNTTSSPVTVTFTITANIGGCEGTPEIATVTVYPTPVATVIPAAQTRCSGEAISSIVPGSTTGGTTYTWTRDRVSEVTGLPASGTGPVPTVTLTNTTSSPITVTFTFYPTANNCEGLPVTATVLMNPKASIRNLTASICNSGTFTVSPVNGTDGVVPPGITYSWRIQSATVGITGAVAGSGSIISGTLGNSTNFTQNVTYAVTPTNDGCVGDLFLLTVTVTPEPAINTIARNVCSGNTFTVSPVNGTNGIVPTGTTYSWTAPTGGISGGEAGSGSNIIGTLVNSTLTPQTATYTVTPVSGTCTGDPFTVNVTVNPVAAVTPMTAGVCSGGSFTVTPVNVTNGTVPSGTTYSWTAPAVTGGVTGGAAGSGLPGISGTLTNPTSSVQTATYTVTPSSGGCAGATFTVTVTVSPRPAVNPMNTTICSGGSFNLIPVDGTNGSVPAGTTYSWTAPDVTGITGTTSGTNVSSISGQLYNTSGTPRTVTYTVIPSAGACAGTSFSVVVTVNPAPSVTDMSVTVCSGASFAIAPVNGTNGTIPPGTTYNWSAPALPVGITGGTSGSGAANISGLLTNSTNTPQTITYVITPSSGSCTGNTVNLTVTVNPVPSVTISGDAEVCYGGTAPNITFTNPVNWPVRVTYTINGGANFTVDIAASGTTSIPATVNQEGTFVYNVVSVAYQTAPTCSTPVTGTTATITVKPITTVVISRTPAGTICFGEPVTFTSNVANAGTNPSYQWYLNGAAVSGATDISYTSTTLNNADKVRLVVTTTDTPCPGAITSNEITMTVNPSVIPSVSIYESENPVCEGTSVTFTANPPVNGGTTPIYQWQLNGSNVGGNSPTFTTNTLVSGDQVRVILTSNANCAVNPATSNTVTMTVNPNLPVSVSVSASANPVCSGTAVTFTATPTNGGTAPVYQWKVNNVNVGSNSNTYSYNPASNDVVTVVLTSSAACATGSPATSTPVTMTVNPNLPVSVSVSASANPVCSGTAVTFTATATNGGTTPVYQWKVNGSNVGSNSNTYSYTPASNDVVTVVLTSSAACATGSPATSTPLTMTVNPNLPVSVSVPASANPVCSGTAVTFTATATNGGTAPVYQWKVNGSNVGSNSNTYSYTPASNDVVTVVLTSNETCATGSPATSTPVTMTVNPNLPVSVSVSASANPVCSGTAVTFTATATNGGTAPVYQWKVNGSNVGSNSNTYSYTPAHNDVVTVVLTSNETCATGSPATSTPLTMTVNPNLPVSVSVSASANPVCSGTAVTFTATATNGGTAPVYQWKVNNVNVGTNSNTYSYTPAHNDVVTVVLTSSAACATGSPATSNGITVHVDQPITETPQTPTGDQSVCTVANLLNYTVTPVANATSYNWTLPTGWTIISGSGTNVITVNPGTPTTGSYNISVRASNACGTSSASPNLTVSVGQFATANAGIDQTICAGQTATMNGLVGGAVNPNPSGNYNWSFSPAGSGSFSGNGRNPVFTPSAAGIAAGTITITLTTPDPAGSCGAVSDQMVLTIRPLPTASISGSTTICSGTSTNITFAATPNTIVTYTVSGVGGQSTIAVGSGGTATLTTAPLTSNTTYTLVSVIYSTAPSCSQTVTGSAIVTVNPTPTVTAGVDQTVCSSSPNVSLAGTRGGSASSATWSGGAGTFNPTNTSLNAVYTPSAAEITAGTVTLTLTTDDPAGPCGPVSDQMVITINPSATANAGADQSVCASSPNVTLAGSVGGAATSGSWSGGAGTFNPTNTSLNAVYTPTAAEIAAGTVTLTLTTNDPAGACPSVTDQMIVTINPSATVNAGADQSVCASSPNVTLAGTMGGSASSVTWSGGAGTFNPTNTSLNVVYTPSATEIAAGTVTLTLTTDDPAGPCGPISDQMVITISPSATVNAGADQTICASSPNVTLAGSVGGAASSGTWSGGAGTFNPTNTSLNAVYTPSASEIVAGTVTLTLTTNDPAGACPSVTDQMIVTINPAPTVSAGSAQTICSGNAVTLAGSISGGATTGTWTGGSGTFNPDRNTLNASYTPSGAEIAAGTITLTLTTTDHPATCGPVSSSTTITIHKAVVITTQPANTGACVGNSAILSVVAVGTNLTYQWFKGTAPGTPISGATSSTLTFNSVSLTDEGSYYVVVSGESPCPSVTSNIVTLNVDAAIAITAQPANQTRCIGENVTFSVSADAGGAPLTYQWRKNGVELSGAILSTYTITGITSVADAGNYDVIVGSTAGFNCSSVTSSAATLIVNENGTISSPANANQTVCANSPITAITYTIGGSSTGAVLTGFLPAGVTHSFSGGVFTISGTPTEQGTFNYTVTATGSPCVNPSLSGTVTVNGIGTISLSGGTATPTVCINNPISTITYSIGGNATGAAISSGSLPTGVTGVYANGLYTISGTPTTAGTYPFTVSTTGSSCGNPSLTGTITVNADATIALTSGNANQTVCIGSPILPISYTSGGSATGMVLTGQLPAGVTYSTSGNVFILSGTPTATGNFNYTVTTTGPCSNTSLSGVIQIDHLADVGYLSPAVSTVCTTTNSGTLRLESYSGNIIQWESSTDGGVTWTVHPVTSNTFTYTNLPNTTLFTALVGNGNCPALYSGIARVTVIPAFTPEITVSGGNVCSGEPVTLTGTAIILPDSTGVITGGDFNHANPRGWRISENGVFLQNFPARNSNENPGPWAETTNAKTFCGTAYDSPDKKFAVVSGLLTSTMETPVFSLVAMSSAEFSFRHAHHLSPGTIAQVELSTDGGNTYNRVLASYSGTQNSGNPNIINAIDIDLTPYLGMENLRIRFNYSSSTACNVWAIDGITLPAPQPDVDYAWGPSELVPGGSGSTVVVLPPTTTTYTLTVWIAGCPGVATGVIVSVVNNPEVQTTNACVGGGPVTFTHNSAITGGTWTVSGGGTITSGGVFTPTEPGCFEATYRTPNAACSGTASFVVFPASPAPTVNAGCGPIVVTPPPAVYGFNVEYSFDNGATWGANTPPTEENCIGYSIKTRYVAATVCGTTLAGAASSIPLCSESPATVRRIDYSDPTFTKPADITIYKDAVCNYDASTGVTGDVTDEKDNCTDVLNATYSDVIKPGQCEDELIIERTWVLADGCGKQNVQIQRITVSDNTPPVISPLAANNQSGCSTGNPNLDPGYQAWLASRGGAAASDNCDQILSWSDNSATQTWSGVAGNNQITITWVVTDNCGNTAQTTATYSITDTQAPTVVCPANISETALINNCGKILATPSDPTVNDNCPDLVLSYTLSGATTVTTPVVGTVAGVTFNVGVTTVTYTATDAAGNKSAPCSFTVTILDVTPPNLTIGGCVNVSESAAAGNCSKIPVTILDPAYSDDCWPLARLTLSWTMTGATTGSGNGSVVGQTFNVGVTTVTYQVEDPDGNKATCSFTVTILRLDIPPAAITCPVSPAPVTAVAGTCFADVTVESPVEVDPCATVTYTFRNSFNNTDNASGSYPVGTTTVTWTITDNSGRTTTCVQTVVVNDLPPTINCPANILAQADFELPYQDAVTVPAPTVTDNCPNPVLSWTLVPPAGYALEYEPNELSGTGLYPSTLFYLGVSTITYTVTDANGNTASCSFTVTILTKPEITCAPAATYHTDEGVCTAIRNSDDYGLPTLDRGLQPIAWSWRITNPDGSQGATGTFIGSTAIPGPPSIPDYAFQLGVSTVTWRAENTSGYEECTQSITVTDNQPPTFTLPEPLTECVERLSTAVYDPTTIDISPVRPDWYILKAGSELLNITGLTDNCCTTGLTIHWRIDLSGGGSITGTGQPSTYGSEIRLPGDVAPYDDVLVHVITFWVEDCHGNTSPEQTQNILIQPRPNLTKGN